ncbi:MAG: hypothetical protein WBP08_00100 [Saprospiraceae bacterium]
MLKKIVKDFIKGRISKIEKILYIDITKILRGAEGDDLTGLQYVLMTGNKFRTSTFAVEGPQVGLIHDYMTYGEAIFERNFFTKTSYYKNAFESVCYLGDYFPAAKKPDDIVNIAKRFVYSYLERDISDFPNVGHNQYSELIIVRPIIRSDCFQIVSGNHRLASAFMKGEKQIKAIVRKSEATHTYFTELISNVIWDKGTALYQPIELPELAHLPVIRKCYDRLEKMTIFLAEKKIELNEKSLLDIGSYYGWFVNEFTKKGVSAFGLERDFSACKVAIELYMLPENRFINKPLEDFILNNDEQYDIVLFLSVLHHFSLEKSFMTDEFVFAKLAQKTKNIMFFETGEEHETMFGSALSGWNDDRIKDFILKNSEFKEVIPLGRDSDNVGDHVNDYQRMLYALIK